MARAGAISCASTDILVAVALGITFYKLDSSCFPGRSTQRCRNSSPQISINSPDKQLGSPTHGPWSHVRFYGCIGNAVRHDISPREQTWYALLPKWCAPPYIYLNIVYIVFFSSQGRAYGLTILSNFLLGVPANAGPETTVGNHQGTAGVVFHLDYQTSSGATSLNNTVCTTPHVSAQ
jgi:hypothetical protein